MSYKGREIDLVIIDELPELSEQELTDILSLDIIHPKLLNSVANTS